MTAEICKNGNADHGFTLALDVIETLPGPRGTRAIGNLCEKKEERKMLILHRVVVFASRLLDLWRRQGSTNQEYMVSVGQRMPGFVLVHWLVDAMFFLPVGRDPC